MSREADAAGVQPAACASLDALLALQEAFDGHATDFIAHIATCAGCMDRLRRVGAFRHILSSSAPLDPVFVDRIVANVTARIHGATRARVVDADVPVYGGVTAVLSVVRRRHEWTLPRELRTVAVLGHVDLDLSAALIGRGTSVIHLVTIMSKVVVTVPDGVQLRAELHPMMSDLAMEADDPGDESRDEPCVVLAGSPLMSTVKVRRCPTSFTPPHLGIIA